MNNLHAGETQDAGAKRMALRLNLCAIAFVGVLVAPFSDNAPLFVKAANAMENSSIGGNNGNGKNSAPGQNKPAGGNGGNVAANPADSIDVDGSDDGGRSLESAHDPLIAEDIPPANIEVIKEIAGLPEDAGLSEEEEMEAIRSGWGTWRTAEEAGITAIR